MGISEILIEYSTHLIAAAGYFGIFALMILESMVLPIPSEAVMPFGGFLISDGQMSWSGVILASALGSLVGSTISYFLGKYAGRRFIIKFGKYLLLNEEHLTSTELFFNKHGQKAVFISRFIPVVRHLISIPAGTSNMPFIKFLLYTLAGATLWNSFLAYIGFRLRDHWDTVKQYTEWLDILVVLIILTAFVYFIYKQLKKRKQRHI